MIIYCVIAYLTVGWLQARVGDKAAKDVGMPVQTAFDFNVTILAWFPLLVWGAFTKFE